MPSQRVMYEIDVDRLPLRTRSVARWPTGFRLRWL